MNIRHAPNCKGEDVHEVTGRFGDLLARCNGCGWFVVMDQAERHHDETPPRRAIPTRLVCRDHHGEAVNARGKGCRECDPHRHLGRRRNPETAA